MKKSKHEPKPMMAARFQAKLVRFWPNVPVSAAAFWMSHCPKAVISSLSVDWPAEGFGFSKKLPDWQFFCVWIFYR